MTIEEAKAEIGKTVWYVNEQVKERGRITSVNNRWVFVRYGKQKTSKATDPVFLSFWSAL